MVFACNYFVVYVNMTLDTAFLMLKIWSAGKRQHNLRRLNFNLLRQKPVCLMFQVHSIYLNLIRGQL